MQDDVWVSFIIVSFNEAKALPLVKAALDRLEKPSGVETELVVVDGGSRDASVEVARKAGYDIVIERPGANIPTCRNAGLQTARGEWIAFVDGDCLLDPQWLVHAARLLSRHPALILGWPAAPPSPGTWVQRAWQTHWLNKNPRVELDGGEAVVKHEGFRLITTRNMIFHRSVATRIGGFDEQLATGEDTDFVFRASMAGIPAWGVPALGCIHLGEPATLRKFFRQQLWHANRRAYRAIAEKSGLKTGGNAPLFTALFLAGVILAAAGLLLALFNQRLGWLGIAPLLLLLGALAARTCWRARKPGHFIPLVILYATYGVARSLDLLGLAPHKPSWKTPAKSA